jgi:hypothetical protein
VTELGAAATDTLRVRERPACVRACVPRSVVRMRHVSTRIPPPGPDALVASWEWSAALSHSATAPRGTARIEIHGDVDRRAGICCRTRVYII